MAAVFFIVNSIAGDLKSALDMIFISLLTSDDGVLASTHQSLSSAASRVLFHHLPLQRMCWWCSAVTVCLFCGLAFHSTFSSVDHSTRICWYSSYLCHHLMWAPILSCHQREPHFVSVFCGLSERDMVTIIYCAPVLLLIFLLNDKLSISRLSWWMP